MQKLLLNLTESDIQPRGSGVRAQALELRESYWTISTLSDWIEFFMFVKSRHQQRQLLS